MIRAFTVTNILGETLYCDLENPYANGVNVRNITGIGPEGVNIATNELAMIDGSVFSSQRAPERNIVFELSFLDMPDGEPVRHLTYKMFSIGSLVRLTFETDERHLYIDGYVESNSPSIFEEEEYTQISIICPDPWFKSTSVVVNHMTDDTSDIVTGFEFGKSYPNKTIHFDSTTTTEHSTYSSLYRSDVELVQNPRDRPCGFVLRCMCREDGVKFGLAYLNQLTESEKGTELISLDIGRNMVLNKGDMLVYSTVPGYRMFYAFVRNGATSTSAPLTFGFPYDHYSDGREIGGIWTNPGDLYERRGAYRSQFMIASPATEDGWQIEVTQERGLSGSPEYSASKPMTIPFRYDPYRSMTEKAPVASNKNYENLQAQTSNVSWQSIQHANETFQSCIRAYDYIGLDPYNRTAFYQDAEYNKAYDSSKAFNYVPLMNALSGMAGAHDSVLWYTFSRGVTELLIEVRKYVSDNPDSSDFLPASEIITDKFDYEYELVPLYEGV